MTNFEWSLDFQSSLCLCLPIQRSDHGPLIISTKPSPKACRRPFKFENFISSVLRFNEVLSKAWATPLSLSQSSISPNALKFNIKLKTVKSYIKSWNKHRVGNLFTLIKSIQKKLGILQRNPQISSNILEEHNLRAQLDLLLIAEETF
ncbi:hypothetical protein LIER_24035 [Lithospermum erythrorhizon]|uniref:Reverse transcriptase n=1 Tax=Lithospermum erythrorhizon TaxID=34254 RepID=A0AAV3R1W6_LITER